MHPLMGPGYVIGAFKMEGEAADSDSKPMIYDHPLFLFIQPIRILSHSKNLTRYSIY